MTASRELATIANLRSLVCHRGRAQRELLDEECCDCSSVDDVACEQFLSFVDEAAAGEPARLSFLLQPEAQQLLLQGALHGEPLVAFTALGLLKRVMALPWAVSPAHKSLCRCSLMVLPLVVGARCTVGGGISRTG